MATITDDFNRANEDPLAGNWTPVNDTVNWTLTSNVARAEPAAGSALFSSARYDGAALDTNDYEVTVTITKDSDTTHGPGPMGRMTPTGTALADVDGYAGAAYNDAFYIVDVSGGTEASVASGGAPGAGPHTITLRMSGTSLTLIEGGVTRASGTDGTWTTGEVGMFAGNIAAATWATYENFSASDYVAPPQVFYNASGAAATAASGNVTPALPAGWAADDIHICHVHHKDNVTVTMPAGWTSFETRQNGASNQIDLFWRRAVGGDGNPTVTHTAGDQIQARISGWRNCVTDFSPIDRTGDTTGFSSVNASDQSIEHNDFSPRYGYEMYLWACHRGDDYVAAISIPGGTTPTPTAQAYTHETTTASDQSGALSYGERGNVDPSAVGSRTSTVTNTNALSIGACFGLIPRGAPAVPALLPARTDLVMY